MKFSIWKKTLREKEKLLVTSNFSFSHRVFKRVLLQTRKNQGLFGKGLNLYQITKNNAIPLLQVKNIVENGENAGYQFKERQIGVFLMKKCNM